MGNNDIRYIALYLPQYHPVEINDQYWGKGFTEWRNVAKAKPLYRNHYQPRIPADFGFYDLRIPEVREEQATLARKYGIEGFCYWHYWFGNGKMVLEKPLEWIMELKRPDFPFCVGWANHSWSNKTWEKTKNFKKDIVFLKQEYPSEEDFILHFNYLLPMFQDPRYIKVDDKPLFLVFDPYDIPDNALMIRIWNELAQKNGLKGIHFVARTETADLSSSKRDILEGLIQKDKYKKCIEMGYDAVYAVNDVKIKRLDSNYMALLYDRIAGKLNLPKMLETHDYSKIIKFMYDDLAGYENVYPMIMPHWDNTPRAGRKGYVYTKESPELFYKSLEVLKPYMLHKKHDHRIAFIHSWNEWGEGAYLEPDLKYGHQYLEQLIR